MAFGHSDLLTLSFLILLFTSLTVAGDNTLTLPEKPAEAPHYFHHHHHHHHHSPTVSPTASPIYPPVKPPVHPPVKPPVHPPVKPPVHPPVKPPVHPPVKPPVTPPVKPPVKPPVYPPVKPPVHPPVKPPVHSPVYPPVKSPAHPPVYPPVRKMVAIRGVVFCKSCKYRGYETLTGASPLAGAVIKLECNNTKYPLREETKTDKNGFFFFMPQKLTTAGSHKCKVKLVSSPSKKCSIPTNLHGGAAGAILVPSVQKPTDSKLEIFTVGPFAFESDKKFACH